MFQQGEQLLWGKARKFSPEFKAQVMLEIVSGKKTLAAVSREHRIKDTVLQRWKTQFLDGLPELVAPGQPAEQKRLPTAISIMAATNAMSDLTFKHFSLGLRFTRRPTPV